MSFGARSMKRCFCAFAAVRLFAEFPVRKVPPVGFNRTDAPAVIVKQFLHRTAAARVILFLSVLSETVEGFVLCAPFISKPSPHESCAYVEAHLRFVEKLLYAHVLRDVG